MLLNLIPPARCIFHFSSSNKNRYIQKSDLYLYIILTLEELRTKAFFQNTIDVWVMFCEEKNWEPYDTNRYRRFISYLNSQGLKMQKFPLCIKESGGMYERGKEKTKFVEQLSQYSSDDAAAYTIKLSAQSLAIIRSFAEQHQ